MTCTSFVLYQTFKTEIYNELYENNICIHKSNSYMEIVCALNFTHLNIIIIHSKKKSRKNTFTT